MANVDGLSCMSCRRGKIQLGRTRIVFFERASVNRSDLRGRILSRSVDMEEAWTQDRCVDINIHLDTLASILKKDTIVRHTSI